MMLALLLNMADLNTSLGVTSAASRVPMETTSSAVIVFLMLRQMSRQYSRSTSLKYSVTSLYASLGQRILSVL